MNITVVYDILNIVSWQEKNPIKDVFLFLLLRILSDLNLLFLSQTLIKTINSFHKDIVYVGRKVDKKR